MVRFVECSIFEVDGEDGDDRKWIFYTCRPPEREKRNSDSSVVMCDMTTEYIEDLYAPPTGNGNILRTVVSASKLSKYRMTYSMENGKITKWGGNVRHNSVGGNLFDNDSFQILLLSFIHTEVGSRDVQKRHGKVKSWSNPLCKKAWHVSVSTLMGEENPGTATTKRGRWEYIRLIDTVTTKPEAAVAAWISLGTITFI
jgi:hypothetical protein